LVNINIWFYIFKGIFGVRLVLCLFIGILVSSYIGLVCLGMFGWLFRDVVGLGWRVFGGFCRLVLLGCSRFVLCWGGLGFVVGC
jgi:hypothetical protein